MNNRAFRFIKEKDIAGSNAIVMTVKEEMVQSLAKDNFGRELSDIELNRFSIGYASWWSDTDALDNLLHDGIEAIVDEKSSDWSITDKLFLEKLNPKDKTECLKEHSELKSRKQK